MTTFPAAGHLALPAIACLTTLATSACRMGPAAADGEAAAAVYAAVAQGVAYVETPLSSGSAVILDARHLVTNAHVVWPYERVRVVLADGRASDDVAVVATDRLADVAVLDALASGWRLAPAPRADGTRLAPGSPVYLVGYPAEVEPAPQPAIARGIVARHRLWAARGLPYIQTDANVAGGQSGGALVDARGRVIGLSGLVLGDGAFALAASMPAVAELAARLAAGDDTDGLAARRAATGGARRLTLTVREEGAEVALTFRPSIGSPWRVRADTPAARLIALDPYGEVAADSAESEASGDPRTEDEPGVADRPGAGAPDGRTRGAPRLELVADVDAAYVLIVTRETPGEVTVWADGPLARVDDPDDDASLARGGARPAALDFPGDIDVFTAHVPAGARWRLTVDTASFVPELTAISPAGDPDVYGRAEHGNALGLAAEADLPAGEWRVSVSAGDDATGGYLLRLADAP